MSKSYISRPSKAKMALFEKWFDQAFPEGSDTTREAVLLGFMAGNTKNLAEKLDVEDIEEGDTVATKREYGYFQKNPSYGGPSEYTVSRIRKKPGSPYLHVQLVRMINRNGTMIRATSFRENLDWELHILRKGPNAVP